MKYKQLTYEQRYQIYACSKAGWQKKDIAIELGIHRSTIYREKKRNKGLKGYRPKQAHQTSIARKKIGKNVKMTSYLKFEIATKLREDWSPEQISGYFKLHNICNISHQTIYDFIKQNKVNGGSLFKHLRQAKKKRRKRHGSTTLWGQIKNRTMIDERPDIVDKKVRIGDWEADTMIGKNGKSVILTLVERKSKFLIARPVKNRSEAEVSKMIISSLIQYKNKVHTITSDNGKEFAGHMKISKKLRAKFFFAHPYSSWERGLNENSNGLLRQYYPKKTNLGCLTQDCIDPVLEKINNRPRKTMDYATPAEVFFGLMNKDVSKY